MAAEADVSAVADPGTGVAIYDSIGGSGWSGGWVVFGGTSGRVPAGWPSSCSACTPVGLIGVIFAPRNTQGRSLEETHGGPSPGARHGPGLANLH